MKRTLHFLRATIAGGIVFLVPIVVLVAILNKAQALTHKIADPLAKAVPFESVLGLRTPVVLALALIVLFCYLAGLLARTALARRTVRKLETTVLSNLPGYDFFKSVGESVLGVEPETSNQVVLARFDDCWQIGFLVERLDNGLLALYIPGAPNPTSGGVYYMTADRITPTQIPPQAAMKSLKRLGSGTNAMLGQIPMGQATAKP